MNQNIKYDPLRIFVWLIYPMLFCSIIFFILFESCSNHKTTENTIQTKNTINKSV